MYKTIDINTGLREVIRNCKGAEHRLFHKGELLFTQGENPKGVYCIETGSVKLYKKDKAGLERIIYLAACGEIIGMHPVVNNKPYFSTAQAISECSCLFVSTDSFMDLINTNNTYKLLVMKSLCSRIDYVEEHIMGVNEKITEKRFADALIMLINKYGINSANALNVNLTLDELASFTCTSKSYMKKVVSEFSCKGLVSITSDVIKILDLPKIQQLAGLV